MKGKLNTFLLKTLLYALPVCIGFELLFRLGFSPMITNSQTFDYKISQAQQQHLRRLKVLAIGSSTGLYGVRSRDIVEHVDPSYYSFCAWGLQLPDIHMLIPDLVRHYRPQYVLLLTTPWDFRFPLNDTYRNYTSMPFFVRDYLPEAFYFRPFTSVHQLLYRKLENYRPDIDRWGSAMVTVPKDRIHREDWDKAFLFPTMATPGAYASLDSLSAWLQGMKIPLIFVEMPVNLIYDNAPEARQLMGEHLRICRSIVTAHGGYFFNYHDPGSFPDSLFFDQSHLQAAGAGVLTQKLVSDLKKIIQ